MLTIIIDTREQQPYSFSSLEISTISRKLNTGDYSIEGYENRFCIERKSLVDYISSITGDRDRFYRELDRMQEMDYTCIVVEGSMEDLLKKENYGNWGGEYLWNTTISIDIDKRIPVFFCGDRQHSIHFCEELMIMYAKHNSPEIKPNDIILVPSKEVIKIVEPISPKEQITENNKKEIKKKNGAGNKKKEVVQAIKGRNNSGSGEKCGKTRTKRKNNENLL